MISNGHYKGLPKLFLFIFVTLSLISTYLDEVTASVCSATCTTDQFLRNLDKRTL